MAHQSIDGTPQCMLVHIHDVLVHGLQDEYIYCAGRHGHHGGAWHPAMFGCPCSVDVRDLLGMENAVAQSVFERSRCLVVPGRPPETKIYWWAIRL